MALDQKERSILFSLFREAPAIIRTAIVAFIGVVIGLGSATILAYIFTTNQSGMFVGYDGGFFKYLYERWLHDQSKNIFLTYDYFGGPADLQFPILYTISLAAVISSFFIYNGYSINFLYYILYFEIFLSCFIILFYFRVNIIFSSLYSIVFSYLVLSGSPGFSLYPITGINPWTAEAIAFSGVLSILVLMLFRLRQSLVSQAGALLLFGLTLLIFVWSSPLIALLALPLPILVGFAAFVLRIRVLLCANRRYLVAVLTLGVCLSIALIPYTAGIFLATASSIFPGELVAPRDHMLFISTFFVGRDVSVGAPMEINAYFYLTAAVSVVYGSLFFRGQIRILALSCAVFLTLLGLIGWYSISVDNYSGVSPLYFEWCAWPIMFSVIIFAAHHILGRICSLILILTKIIFKKSNNLAGTNNHDTQLRFVGVSFFFGAFAIALASVPGIDVGWLSIPLAEPSDSREKPEIISDLRSLVGYEQNSLFEGRVLNLTGIHRRSEDGTLSWPAVASGDNNFIITWNNDLRTFGPWSEGIPTVIQYNQSMSPLYYYHTTRNFGVPGDMRIRSLLMFSEVDHEWLLRWGVRLVLSDSELNYSWLHEVGVYPLDREPSHPVRIYEVSGWRSHWASITHQDVVSNPIEPISSAFERFDSAEVAVMFDSDVIRIIAENSETQTIVIPAVYSNCFSATSYPEKSVINLFPAYDSILGIEIEGVGEYVVDYKYSPFHNPLCRIKDWRFASSFLGSEPEWLAPLSHSTLP